MQKNIVLVILLSFIGISAYAQTDIAPCKSGIRSIYNSTDISDMEKLVKPLSRTALIDFTRNLCGSIQTSIGLGEKMNEYLHKKMADYIGVKQGDADYQEKMKAFWNLNSHNFVCTYFETGDDEVKKMHILKLIAYQQVPYDFKAFLGKLGAPVNVNDIEIHNGVKETVLDYLLRIKGTKRFENLNVDSLISYIVRKHNAKRARDL